MSRELRITLSIMIVALIVFSPAIFAESAVVPSNASYLAAVFHIVVTPPTPTPCQDVPEDCADYATDAAIDATEAAVDAMTATALATRGPSTATSTTTPGSGTPMPTVMPPPTPIPQRVNR